MIFAFVNYELIFKEKFHNEKHSTQISESERGKLCSKKLPLLF
jgi:hypothetical protein